MCTIIVAQNALPGFPVVVAANRDEALDRPAAPPSWWKPRGAALSDAVRYPATDSVKEWGDEVPIDADRSRECRCRVVNRPIVVDDNLLTTRQPGDIAEAFNPGMIDLFRSSARAGAWGTA